MTRHLPAAAAPAKPAPFEDEGPLYRERRRLLRTRWAVACAAAVMMMCLGTVYSWSVMARPLIAAFHWSTTTTMWAFSTAIFSLGVGAICGGRWQDRVGPRNVAIAGVALWALGNILAGTLTPQYGAWMLYLTYGVIGGFGLGMGYVSPVAMVTKWFPDHRGLASGLVLTGFGLGAFFYNGIASLIAPFARATNAAAAYLATGRAMSDADVSATMAVFVWSGIAYLAIGGLCALMLRNPPAVFGRRATDPAVRRERNFTPRQVLRTPQFYLLWSMLFCSVAAGIAIISNAVPIFTDLTGTTAAFAAPVIGFLAAFNGAGRILWGELSDRTGRNTAYVLILAVQAAVFGLLPELHAPLLVGAAFAVVMFCNGGSFGTMPAFNADYFGTRYMGLNYGMLLSAWGFAGIAGPLLAARVKDVTGSYTATLVPLAALLTLATIIPMVACKPGETSRFAEMLRKRTTGAVRIAGSEAA